MDSRAVCETKYMSFSKLEFTNFTSLFSVNFYKISTT